MGDLILTTYDWVPPPPRGYVRDLRVRWALEEAGLPYRVESTPFKDRGPDHFAHQPFGQAPGEAMVVGEAIDVMVERVQRRRGDDAERDAQPEQVAALPQPDDASVNP